MLFKLTISSSDIIKFTVEHLNRPEHYVIRVPGFILAFTGCLQTTKHPFQRQDVDYVITNHFKHTLLFQSGVFALCVLQKCYICHPISVLSVFNHSFLNALQVWDLVCLHHWLSMYQLHYLDHMSHRLPVHIISYMGTWKLRRCWMLLVLRPTYMYAFSNSIHWYTSHQNVFRRCW